MDRYIPLYLCWDACPSSGIPTAVAGLRIGARWHWPDIFPHAFVSGGVGVYAPLGRSPYWQSATPGIDIGMGYLSAQDRTLVVEHRLIWLPGSPSAPVLLQMTLLKSL